MSDGRFKDQTVFIDRVIARQLTLGPFGPPGTRPRVNLDYLSQGSPLGRVVDNPGSLIVSLDPVGLWQKQSGGHDASEWAQLAFANATKIYHEPILKPGSAVNSGSTTSIATNALLLTAFTLNSDGAWQQFKIPDNYVSDPAFHIHWSKTTNANNAGRNVRWRISYSIFDGSSENGAGAPTVAEVEDTYEDSSTSATSRIVYRTDDIPIEGFVAGYYMAVEIQAVTPSGLALSGEPGLFTLDLTYRQYINQ